MECPQLKIIVTLIKEYTQYKSNELIANRIGIKEKTLRGYWDLDAVPVPTIPERNKAVFVELVKEIVSHPLSDQSAQQLLKGSAINFHNALLPPGGAAWQALIDRHSADDKIQVLRKTDLGFAFGESDDEDTVVPDATFSLNQSFYFTANTPWRGEAVVIAEHLGQWHICGVSQTARIAPLNSNPVCIPPKPIGLRERNNEGIYRYFIVGVKGKFSSLLREQVHKPNPPQPDAIADLVMAHGEGNCLVWGATIRIQNESKH